MSRLKDVPELRRDGSNLSEVMQAVRETLQTFRGYRGDPLDTALTLREAIDRGVLMRNLFSPAGSTGSSVYTGPGGSGWPVDGPYIVDLTHPPTPEGLDVVAAISNLLVKCSTPAYTAGHGHALTVVYGAKWPTATVTPPTFVDAVELFRFAGTVSGYSTNPATRWCIWIKWLSKDGVLSADPAGGTNGFTVTTGQDVSLLLEALASKITSGQLHATLNSSIDLIGAADSVSGSVNARIKSLNDTLQPQINALALTPDYDAGTAYAIGTTVKYASALWQCKAATTAGTAPVLPGNAAYWDKVGDYDSLATAVGAHEAGITALNFVDATSTSASARALSNLHAQVNTPTTGVAAVAASAFSAAETAVTDTEALALRAESLETSVNHGTTGLATKASVTQVATAKSEAIAASASVTDTISARLNTGDFAAVQTQSSASASAVTGLQAQYTVKIDAANHVAGFGLATTSKYGEWDPSWGVVALGASQAGVGIQPHDALLNESFSGRKLGDVTNSGVVDTSDYLALTKYDTGLSILAAEKTYIETVLGPKLSSDPVKYSVYLKPAVTTSEFGVQASRFYVAPPAHASATEPVSGLFKGFVWVDTSVAPNVTKYRNSVGGWSSSPTALPFVVVAEPVYDESLNEILAPGVYMEGAYIKDLNADRITAGTINADVVNVINVTAVDIEAGSVMTGTLESTGTAVVGGTAVKAWKINGDGTATFNTAVVRGTMYASAGLIGGNTIDSTSIHSGTTGYGTGTGFYLGSNGTFSLGDKFTWDGTTLAINGGGTFSGALSAATGSFAGALSAATGSFSGSLSAATGSFAGSLTAATGSFAGSLSAATGTFSGSLTASAINAVDTINIAGNAVTIPLSAYTSGTSATFLTYTAQTLAVVASGGKILITGEFFLEEAIPGSRAYVYLKRSGTTIKTYSLQPEGKFNFVYVDEPAAGTYSYTILLDATGLMQVSERLLYTLETKK